MDVKKRLLRRPVRTVLWQLVLVSMSLLIGISGTMVYSAEQLTAIVDQRHTTVAVQSYYERANQYGGADPCVALSETEVAYLENMDMVELVDMRTLTGAYIPQLEALVGLIPWGELYEMDADHWYERNLNGSYDQVAVVGTVEDSWTVWDDFGQTDLSLLGKEELLTLCYHYAILNVEEILVMNGDYDILPTEEWSYYTGKVFVQTLVYDESDEPWFQTGERYLVTGSYDPSAHGMATSVRHTPEGVSLPWIKVMDPFFGGTYGLMEEERMVVYQDAEYSYPNVPDTDRLEVLETVDGPVTVVQHLEGTTEELLAEDAAWAQRIERLQMAQHTFPVLGTEALETMQYFVSGDAVISEGRMFTQEEYDSGAPVCVISETLAQTGGVQVGDTLSVSQYLVAETYEDGNYSVPVNYFDEEANEPAVGKSIIPNGLVTENEAFTVVGIYRLSRSWEATAFAFTPNTVFIPQKAQIVGGYGGPARLETQRYWSVSYSGTDMSPENIAWEGWEEYDTLQPRGSYGVYMSVKLKNGTMTQFQDALADSPLLLHRFLTFDQGFEEAQEGIRWVTASARKLFGLAAAGWALLLGVYVLLSQSAERRNLGIMRSVGAGSARTRRYLFFGGFLQAVLGILIGTALTGTVTALVQDKLISLLLTTDSGGLIQGSQSLTEMLMLSSIPAAGLLLLAVGQMAVFAAVLWLHAVLLSRKHARKLLEV